MLARIAEIARSEDQGAASKTQVYRSSYRVDAPTPPLRDHRTPIRRRDRFSGRGFIGQYQTTHSEITATCKPFRSPFAFPPKSGDCSNRISR